MGKRYPVAGSAPGHGQDEVAGCPVCGRPVDHVGPPREAHEVHRPDTQCPECGWTLESPLHAGAVTEARTEEFALRLRDAQRALDARVVARISADPDPYLGLIRGGPPDEAQWAAARRAADLDTRSSADEATLRSRLAALVAGLRADAQAAVVEVSADGIVTTRLGLDHFGSPWLDRTASTPWSSLLPMLSSAEHERYFELAGGLGRRDRDAIAERLRAAAAGLLTATSSLSAGRRGGWSPNWPARP